MRSLIYRVSQKRFHNVENPPLAFPGLRVEGSTQGYPKNSKILLRGTRQTKGTLISEDPFMFFHLAPRRLFAAGNNDGGFLREEVSAFQCLGPSCAIRFA